MVRKYIKYSLFILYVVACYSCSPRRSEPLRGPLVLKNQRLQNGMKMYMIHCQKCHPNGEAGLGPALNSNPAPGFVKRFQVRHGLGVMPAFNKREIASDDLRDLGKYMKALKHR
jgi:mono/diheme cytochrome c family protein